MSTIATLKTKSGQKRYKAIIKSGGRVIKTKTFTKKSNARTWAKRIENDQEALYALGLSGSKLTLKELATEYNDGHVLLFKMVNKIGPAINITDITTDQIRVVLNWYGNGISQRSGKPRKPATFNRTKALISGMFGFAIKQGYLSINPVKPIPTKFEDNKIIRYLSDSERDRLFEAVRNADWDKFELLVILAITTGARRNELMRLRWADIDFEYKTASLKTSKNGEPRSMPLPIPAIKELKKFRGVGDCLIFASKKKPKRPFHFNKQWYKALEDADITKFRFHDLRHSCASYLAMNGCSLLEIAEVLGHKSLETTKRYAHLSTEHKAKVISRVFDKMI